MSLEDTNTNDLFGRLVHIASGASANRVAVSDGRMSLTYDELVEAASTFSDALDRAGIGGGDRVGLILGNQAEFLIAAFGTWKRGSGLVPLNPQFRETELFDYIRDSSLRAVVATARASRTIEALRARGAPIAHAWLCTSTINRWTYDPARAPDVTKAENPTLCAELPAITQYSTGSTGRPKRVGRSHGQLIAEARSIATALNISSSARTLGVAPFFHSYGLMVSALATLLRGGTLYPRDTFLPSDISHLIEREQITGFPGVPPMFHLLCEAQTPRNLSSLSFAVSAGGPLSRTTAMAFEALYGLRIRQLYGTTETGVISIADENANAAEVGTVGRPIPDVSIEVVDEDDRPMPAGKEGRVRVASSFAALAYQHHAGNNESHFAGKYFFPGDLGRLSPRGDLTLCGRQRHFINVNGYKVDPAEVETVLLQIPLVVEAIVLGVEDGLAGEQVKAVIVASASVSHQAVRAHCAQRLAAFKCPQVIEFRREIPRSTLGKVLLGSLVEDASGGRNTGGATTSAPANRFPGRR